MKVKDIIKKISDPKIYIEIKYTIEDGGGSFGIFTKNDLQYNDKMKNKNIEKINIQYYDSKRLLILEVK